MSKDRFEKTYRPLPDNVQLDYSPIEGMGVFAKYDLDGKIFIGITHIAPRKKDYLDRELHLEDSLIIVIILTVL